MINWLWHVARYGAAEAGDDSEEKSHRGRNDVHYPHLTPLEVARIDALLTTPTVLDVDSRIAQLSGQLRASYSIKALDSFIAATALMTGTTLALRNVRDFQRIPNLDSRVL